MARALLLAVFTLLAGTVPAVAEKPRAAAPAPKPAPPPAPPRPAPKPAAKPAPQQQQAQVGQQLVRQWSNMTPRQREQFLASLPPQRRDQIRKKLNEYNNIPPGSISKVQPWLERLGTLPPEKQRDVRQSLRQLNDLPLERRIQLRREMSALSSLPPEKRKLQLGTDDMRSRYSPQELEIMGHLSDLLPAQ